MEIRKLVAAINRYEKDVSVLEKFIVRFYIDYNSIADIKNSKSVWSYCFIVDEKSYQKFKKKLSLYFKKNDITNFDIDMLVNIYELLIPIDERKTNGMVFTPHHIKEFIINKSMSNVCGKVDQLKICDPSCGCASFLITISKYLNEEYGLTYKYIYTNIIYGVDIYEHNIKKSKLLLELLALENGEFIDEQLNYNLIVANSLELDFEWTFKDVFHREFKGFDIVIGNPPYVRSKNISDEIKDSLNRWEVSKVGNTDLYISFFQLGLELLNDDGILGYISVNTYLTSLNGRVLRAYLREHEYSMQIINFKDYQMFKGVTSYTCINIFHKSEKTKVLSYMELDKLDDYCNNKFNKISLDSLNDKQGWSLGEKDVIQNINKIRRFDSKLEKYGIKNGIATLKNNIYIISPYNQDERYLYFYDINGQSRSVEKEICKRIVKPNVIKEESELTSKIEYIIFPYYEDEFGKNRVLDEETFENIYPRAHAYLDTYKLELLKRDKGKAEEKYPAWYAFGRTQGMNNYGKKVFIPYMAKSPVAVLSTEEDILFYCGYALFSDDLRELMYIKKILLSNVFWYYVKNTSKPYSGGYMSLAKNYLKDFSIPDLSDEQIDRIINEQDQNMVNKLLVKIYDIEI